MQPSTLPKEDAGEETTFTKIELESNYGSEIGPEDEAELSALLSQAESHHPSQVKATPTLMCNSIEDGIISTRLHLVDEDGIPPKALQFDVPVRESSVEIEYDVRNRHAFSPKPSVEEGLQVPNPLKDSIGLEAEPQAEDPDPHDTRTPLQRFKAKRPLSVTNIVSPAWCELQYWYNLTKYGKVRRTKAMEQGSSLHQVIEEQTTTRLPVDNVKTLVQKVLQDELKKAVTDEVITKIVQKVLETEKRPAVPVDVAASLVHKVLEKEKIAPIPVSVVSESVHKALGEKMRIAVPVEVTTKEDAFALRIWNIIHGLRTLRATGLAREIEVWAVVEGEVVNGVIDELSFESPDEELEAKILEQRGQQDSGKGGKRKRKESLLSNQPTIHSLWPATPSTKEEPNAWLGAPHQQRKVYLADIKTRRSSTLPSNQTALRPTAMQLMMYHRMLSLLASNSVPADQVFARYNLSSDIPLSDSFIAQIASLDLDISPESVIDSSVLSENEQDVMDEILAHNSLEKLWTLMMSEFARAIPFSANSGSAPSPIGDVLKAEYRDSASGFVIGTKTFAFDALALDSYVKDVMAWWRGERMPKGVDIEEAYKCRMCDFADQCSWRKEKVDQSLRQASRNRLRRQERRKSEV